MRDNPKPFEIYRHFKGNKYQILALAKDSETQEIMVVYQALYGDYSVWVRPLAMFMSEVDKVKYPNERALYRFEKVTKATEIVTETAEKTIEKVPEAMGKESDSKEVQVAPVETKTTSAEVKKNVADTSDDELSADDILDKEVVAFLDAGSYEKKLNILFHLRSRITKEMLNVMAISTDIELNEGTVEEQYDELKRCLLQMEKYECNRLR